MKKLLVLGAVVIAALGAYLYLTREPVGARHAVPLPVHAEIPEFHLVAEDAAPFSRNDLKGSVWIADFIFTRCSGACPVMAGHMYKLQESLPKSIRFVSFTVDPEYDTPERLKAYAEITLAESGRWRFLTGDMAVINRVAAGVHLGKVDEPLMHSQRFVLIDKTARVRGYYDSNDPAHLRTLEKDAKSLA